MNDIYKQLLKRSLDDAVSSIEDAEGFEGDPAPFALELFRFRCMRSDERYYDQLAETTMNPLPDGLDRDKQ